MDDGHRPTRMAKIKKAKTPNVFKDVEQFELSCTDGENVNQHLLECSVMLFTKVENTCLYDSAIPPPVIQPSELCTHKNQETYARMFRTALFKVTQI